MEACDFECNICLELANDPIVTPCGHLYCWPCIYKWLYFHSKSNQCPVCKASIQEEKLVPLYGRGKTNSDPRSRPVHCISIPNRPSGQRPVTTDNSNNFPSHGFGFGFRFGGLLPSLMSFQVSNTGFWSPYEEPHHVVDMDRMRRQVHDLLCKTVLLGFGFLILFIFMDDNNGFV